MIWNPRGSIFVRFLVDACSCCVSCDTVGVVARIAWVVLVGFAIKRVLFNLALVLRWVSLIAVCLLLRGCSGCSPMGKRKPCRNLFQTDLREESSPYMDPLRQFPDEDEPMNLKPLDRLLPAGFSWDQPRLSRVESYRAPPLKPTLETIQEDASKPDVNYLRSKSLPAQRRFAIDSCGHGLQRFPSYRAGQGDYLPGVCGVTMSGPILPSTYDYDSAPKLRRSRFSTRFSRMRDALRSSRFRQALNSMFSRMKPSMKPSSRRKL